MKKTILLTFLVCSFSIFSQEIEKPHLERKNEIRFGFENFIPSLEYERQIGDNISLGGVVRFNSRKGGIYDDELENLNLSIRGRAYIKDYITQSFLYIFFDDAFKIRYFLEGNMGYSFTDKKITERILDSNNNYILRRNNVNTNGIIGSFGFGAKLLLKKKYSLDWSFGPGRTFTGDYEYYGYFRIGAGYRF